MTNKRRLIVIIITFSLLGLFFFSSCKNSIEKVKNSKKANIESKNKKGKRGDRRGKKKGDLPLVELSKVNRKSLNSYLVLNGTVEPEKSIKVYTRLSAFVDTLVKEEGDMVKAGDTLAILDDSEIQISYKQSKIQLELAKLNLDDEEKNFERNKELMKKELISEKDFQTSETVFRKAKLEYSNKEEDYRNLSLQLSFTRIKAQNSGYITERLVEKGDKVALNQHVFTIEDFDPLLVKVFVPTSDVIKLKKQMKADIKSDILKNIIFNGRIKLINPRIDVQSGTVKVTIEVFDKTFKLKPGMFVEVKIIIGEKENIIVIPKKSIVYKRDKKYVFVFDKGKVMRREVETGITEEDDIEINSGLKEGEKIIVVGVEALKEGNRVKVVK